MAKNPLFIFVLIFIICGTLVHAECYPGTETPGGCDFSNVNNWDNVNWNEVDQSQVPPEHTDKIPPEHVDVTAVQDQSKLTDKQLAYGNNIEKIQDPGKLNPDALDEALSVTKDGHVQVQKPGPIQTNGNELHFERADFLQIDDLNAENVEDELEYANIVSSVSVHKNKRSPK